MKCDGEVEVREMDPPSNGRRVSSHMWAVRSASPMLPSTFGPRRRQSITERPSRSTRTARTARTAARRTESGVPPVARRPSPVALGERNYALHGRPCGQRLLRPPKQHRDSTWPRRACDRVRRDSSDNDALFQKQLSHSQRAVTEYSIKQANQTRCRWHCKGACGVPSTQHRAQLPLDARRTTHSASVTASAVLCRCL